MPTKIKKKTKAKKKVVKKVTKKAKLTKDNKKSKPRISYQN